MNLIISLSNPDILPETLRTRRVEFGSSGGLIGRHQDCDWVLDDPERFVSSRHLKIVFKGDTFYAEDISTNGTYLNEDLIGKGNKLPLATGDVLRLGRFILSVEQRGLDGDLIGDTHSAASSDLLADTSHGQEALDDFIKTDDLLADPGETEEIDAFIGQNETHDHEDDLLSDAAPLPAVQDALPVMRQMEPNQAVPEDWMNQSPSTSAQPAKNDDVMASSLMDDTPAPSTDETSAGDFGLTPVPPQDIEGDIFEDPDVEAVKTQKKSKSKVKTKPKDKVKSKEKAKPNSKSKVKAKTEAKTKKPKKKTVETTDVSEPILMGGENFVDAAMREPISAPAPIRVPEDFGTALAQAVNLRPDAATGENGHTLGLVMRELLEGSLDMMASRNQMRQELRLSGTMVGARENNPFKLSINYQDALGRMLQGEDMGFKPAVDSTKEVMDDLRLHQLGILTGIDAGVKALLNALDPKNLNNTGKMNIPGLSMTSKMSEHHARITEDTLERSDGVFWRSFAEAYKTAIARSYEN